MANVSIQPQIASTLHLVISPISELDKTISAEVYIHGIPWKVEVEKDEEEQSFGVHLRCAKEDDPSNWTVPACATINLMTFSDEKNARKTYITPYGFDTYHQEFGCDPFIQWDELLKDENKYVKDDTIKLKVKITAGDPNYVDRSILKFENIDKSCDCGATATIRLTVSNVENLMAVRSSEFIVRGLPWDLTVYKCQKSTLGIMLQARKSPKKV